jgi:hypothetical protein
VTRMNATTQCLRCQTLGLSAFANGLRLVRSASDVMLASFQEVPTALRNIIARLERGFADFAQIPYEDSLAQRELLLLLDEFAADCSPTIRRARIMHHSTRAGTSFIEPSLPDVQLRNRSGDPERFVRGLKTNVLVGSVRDGQQTDVGPPNAVRVQTLDHVVYLSGAVSEGGAAS